VTLADGSVVARGATYIKTWRFRNDDAVEAWPAGTRLLFVGKNSSDRMAAPDEVLVQRPVQPGDELDISVPLTAPNAPGRYCAYFRLSDAQGRRFGQRVWASVLVKDTDSSSSSSSSSSEEDNSDHKASNDSDVAKYEHQLQLLAELGLCNVRLNVRLLNRFEGNAETVAQRLFARRAKHQARLAANPELHKCKGRQHACGGKYEAKMEAKAVKLEAKLEKKAERVAAKAERLAAKANKCGANNNTTNNATNC